ncbi:hypothetical protein KAJ27_25890 [bacterium]|nr:hypothetical protein [bacterium]
MKTAISIPDNLFEKVELLAQELSFSRSKVFAMAMQEFIDRYEAQQLLNNLNNAYSEDDQSDDDQLCKRTKRYYSKRLKRKSN